MASGFERLAPAGRKSLFALLMSSFLWAGPGLAHEDYAWVRDPSFLTASGAHCCSEQHCQPAATGELTPIPGGWRHVPTMTEIKDDKPGIYPTRDKAGRIFRCVMGGALVCVFEGISS